MEEKRAFTLLELLVVVAVVSILAAIALPHYQNALIRSKLSHAQADMETLNKAVYLKVMDDYGIHSHPLPCYSYGPFCMGYRYLTTPVAYLSTIDQAFDIFGVDTLKKDPDKMNTFTSGSIDELEIKQICYEIHWRWFVPYTGSISNMGKPMENDLTGVKYRISMGPDEILQNGLVGLYGRSPYYFFIREAVYEPSNGIRSAGDVMITNYPLDKILLDRAFIKSLGG